MAPLELCGWIVRRFPKLDVTQVPKLPDKTQNINKDDVRKIDLFYLFQRLIFYRIAHAFKMSMMFREKDKNLTPTVENVRPQPPKAVKTEPKCEMDKQVTVSNSKVTTK